MQKIGASAEDYELDINPKQVCRLCLDPTNLQSVFSNSIVDGYIISMPEILRYAIDITVRSFVCFSSAYRYLQEFFNVSGERR